MPLLSYMYEKPMPELGSHLWNINVYIDGMIRTVAEVVTTDTKYLDDVLKVVNTTIVQSIGLEGDINFDEAVPSATPTIVSPGGSMFFVDSVLRSIFANDNVRQIVDSDRPVSNPRNVAKAIRSDEQKTPEVSPNNYGPISHDPSMFQPVMLGEAAVIGRDNSLGVTTPAGFVSPVKNEEYPDVELMCSCIETIKSSERFWFGSVYRAHVAGVVESNRVYYLFAREKLSRPDPIFDYLVRGKHYTYISHASIDNETIIGDLMRLGVCVNVDKMYPITLLYALFDDCCLNDVPKYITGEDPSDVYHFTEADWHESPNVILGGAFINNTDSSTTPFEFGHFKYWKLSKVFDHILTYTPDYPQATEKLLGLMDGIRKYVLKKLAE